jgi:hypothetical protein
MEKLYCSLRRATSLSETIRDLGFPDALLRAGELSIPGDGAQLWIALNLHFCENFLRNGGDGRDSVLIAKGLWY